MSIVLPSLCNVTITCGTTASEGASLGLELNWQKTKVQALGSREDVPSTITVLGQEVAVVEEFVYLGSLVHSSTQSSPDISRRNAITRAAMRSAFYLSSCMALSAGQSPREMYSRSTPSTNGVCESC